MHEIEFDPITRDWLHAVAGNYILDKTVFTYAVIECGTAGIPVVDWSQEQKDRCKIEIYRAILMTPYQTSSYSNQHGNWREDVGLQTMTEANRAEILARYKALCKKYGETELLEEIDDASGVVKFIDEGFIA